MSFVHLHNHSEYSLLEASNRIKSLAKKAASLGMPAVALTDSGNMFGAIEFYFAAQEAGVKPIIGLEVFLAPAGRFEKKTDNKEIIQWGPRRLVLLAQNLQGYQNLCQLSTLGFREGFYYRPRVDDELIQKYSEGVICLSGGLRGDIPDTFLKEGPEAALARIQFLKQIYGDRFYLEMNRTGLKEWDRINPFLIEASGITHTELVAANDVHYMGSDDKIAQEVLICIGNNRTLSDEFRPKLGSSEFYFKSSEQMHKLFADVPQALSNTLTIADRCELKFKLKDDSGKPIYHLPTFPTEEGVSLAEEIKKRSFQGLEVRFTESKERGEEVPEEKKPDYFKRLDYELSVIEKMGFNGYFLIVQDFINWAKSNDIPVGPGRGSGAGSLVAYCLRITDLDPFPSSLLFERFLNPERISMPDFDIDFCQDRRGEVIDYVTQKYGQDSVSQIITYGKLMAKAAIKDVCRVMGMTFAEADVISKLIPEKPGTTISDALEQEPRLRELIDNSPQVANVIDLAQRIEGMVRNAGIHAAGVIIADGNLVQKAPLYRGADGENVVQYDMKHAEKIGLIKFDFLGLKTLTHIQRALKLIEKNRGKKLTTNEISLKDKGIYEIMSKGDTLGIFQFEGEGITGAIRQIKPTSFGDITAINALYRPGPMEMIPTFAKRKHGEEPIEFPFEELREMLGETYGIIVYQEQVMGIASRIAGYSLGESDMLRRAMGKKNKEEMDKQRERFLSGAAKNNFDLQKSNEVFDLMYRFADYGFNKSHAAAYCVIAAQTAWLKNYYPVEFFAALLSTELGNTDNVVRYSKDAQKHQIEVLPPHVNFSEFYFTCQGDKIYFGLGAIKGVGENAIQAIVEARESLPHKKFESIEEFFQTVDPKKMNKKVIECLIKAGAFDQLGAHRAQLMSGYTTLLERAQREMKDKELGQSSLFDLGPASDETKVQLPDVQPWTRSVCLSFEKEVLGFYLSDHPLKGYDLLSKIYTTCSIAELGNLPPLPVKKNTENDKPWLKKDQRRRVLVSGLISELRETLTKKGTRMAFAKIEDLTSSCELVIFPDPFQKFEFDLKSDKPVLIGGGLEAEDGNIKIMVDSIATMDDVMKKSKKLIIHLDQIQADKMNSLDVILKTHPGPTGVSFEKKYLDQNRKVQLEPEEGISVGVTNEFLENIFTQFGNTEFLEIRG